MRVVPTTPWISYCSAGRPPTRSCRGAEICFERRPRVSVPTPSRAKRLRLVARSALSSVTTIRYWRRARLPNWMSAASFSAIFDQLAGTAIRQLRSVAVTHFMLTLASAARRCAVAAVVGAIRLVLGVHGGLKTICTSADRPISPATTPIQADLRRRCRCRLTAGGGGEGGEGGGGHVAMGGGSSLTLGAVAVRRRTTHPFR